MLRLSTLVILATASRCADSECEANSLLQHGASHRRKQAEDDLSICRNPRQMECDIFWNPFSKNAAQTSCGFGAVCMTAGSSLPNVCKCQMGSICGPDGACRARSTEGKSPAAAPATGGSGGAQVHESYCTNERAQPCKIGFTPFDSAAMACGFGQTCQQVADGRALCQCAMGACGSDGNCAFFNPFDPFASQSPKEAQPAAPAAAVPVEDGVPEDAAPQIEGAGKLDASFCTNTRARVCKIGFTPFFDSHDLACGFGQTCQKVPDGRALCQCAMGMGSCDADGKCGINPLDPFGQQTQKGATTAAPEAPSAVPEAAAAGAAGAAGAATEGAPLDSSFCTNQRAQQCKIGFIPFSDSADLACGFGQTCQQAADGRALCKCAVGSCTSDGSCGGFEDTSAQKTNATAATPDATAGATTDATADATTDATADATANATAGTASTSLDESFCTNQRVQACKISFNPFSDSADAACGLGQTCQQIADGQALCKCAMGICQSDGSCALKKTDSTVSQGTNQTGAASGSLDASFCTNQRAQACKIGFIPFMDSSDLACGLGQTCETAADGRALCKCAAGTCGESGNCGGFQNPFAHASQANSSANGTKSAGAGTASGSLDAAFCTNQRAQACKIGFIPFIDSSDLACGLGQTCETAADGRALCKCAAGTCGESGDCGGFQNPFAQASQANSSANGTKSAGAGTAIGSLDAAFCTNQRAQACKIGFIPFMDSSDLACGLGQTCETGADGRALCKCAAGTCGESGNCGGFQNPFAHASQANSSANGTKSAGTASGSLDAAFCTNQRAQACKIGFIPFMDSSDLACGLGQTCETATDGRALCKCAAGTCSESGDCGGFQNPFAQTTTLAQTAPETAPESAVQTASQGAGQMSSSTAI